ncbi:MAG: hypothetical protein H8D22_04920 [Candidatus Cloacimonetes bacterium]|nr:hypothetical protein [Candidatus Cloacimonadota bacterium]
MDKFRLCNKILRNNRLEDYNKILKNAKGHNYQIISLRDYVNSNYKIEGKILILRHDIDKKSKATKKMLEIEQKYNAKASYYFLPSTADKKLIKKIEKYGSEASLHFNTLGDFIRRNSIKSKEELYKYNFQEECLNVLKREIEYFRKLFKIPCETIASHGSKENRLVDTPNTILTEDANIYKMLKIKLEAYNKYFINSINSYIADCELEKNNGYRGKISPIDAFEKNEKFILFLSHPQHWYKKFFSQLLRIVKVLTKI